MASENAPNEHRPQVWQFSLRGLLLSLVPVCVLLALVGLKLRQDFQFSAATERLTKLGIQTTIMSWSGRTTVSFTSRNPGFTDANIAELLTLAKILTRSRDLGLSGGLELEEINLTDSAVTTEGIETIRRELPSIKVLR